MPKGNHSRRSSGGGIIQFILVCCVLLVIAAAGYTIFKNDNAEYVPPESSAPQTNAPIVRPTDPAPIITMPNGEVTPTPEPEAEATPTPGAEQSAPPEASPDASLNPLAERASDMGRSLSVTVPSSAAVGDEYFADAVFIGDSRTEGLKMYSGITDTTYWCKVGLTVTDCFSDQFVVLDGQWLTVAQALERADYKKVYIMLGMNELGWVYESKYAEDYARIIDVIRESHPDAIIYAQSIIPVSKWRDSNDDVNTMANVVRLQKALAEMCESRGVNYVNVAEVMEDAEGYLPSYATQDGLHLTPDYYKIWTDYLKTHTTTK